MCNHVTYGRIGLFLRARSIKSLQFCFPDRSCIVRQKLVEKKKKERKYFNRFITRIQVLYYYLFVQPRVAITTENML